MGRFADRLARSAPLSRGASHSGDADDEDTRARRLEALRARLGKMVGAVTPTPRAPGRRGCGSPAARLPFDSVATADGQLHVRTVSITPAQKMGSVGLAGALRADPRMLSLLALCPEIAEIDARRALYLDAETTGLGNGTGNYPFLMGVCSLETDCGEQAAGLVLHQYLLRDPADEPALLARLHEHIRGADLLISYNGKSFDLPLLRSRFVMNRMKPPREPPHLDLLHVARRIHKRRRFRKSLTTLEREVLGFARGPNDVGGAEVAERYLHYLHTRDESELADVVEHNELDVLTLVALTALYGEPLRMLAAEELASVADVILRAGDSERARSVADEAVRRGATDAGLMSRALIHKARGDREHALADFERLSERVDDPDVRLELAKLYEHFVRDHERALALTLSGTNEAPLDRAKRRRRLEDKVRRARRGAALETSARAPAERPPPPEIAPEDLQEAVLASWARLG